MRERERERKELAKVRAAAQNQITSIFGMLGMHLKKTRRIEQTR